MSISLVNNFFSLMDISSFGSLINSRRYVFHSAEVRRDNICLLKFNPFNDLAGKSLPNCPIRVSIELSPYNGNS